MLLWYPICLFVLVFIYLFICLKRPLVQRPSWLICIQVDVQVCKYLVCGHLLDIGLVENDKREYCLPQPTPLLPP